MRQKKSTEITVGLFVALGIAALAFLTMKVSNLSGLNDEVGYVVTAEFENVGGLKARSPVTLAGVRVGRVESIHLDPNTYDAIVTLNLYSSFNTLPTDTAASIYTAGLLGEQYIGLEAGAEEEFLKEGDVIELTQPALVLEQVIGQFLFSKAEGGDE
jgi:phospholipid/cholesterol/gamma-HCH transport system substrate-binding protein